MKEKVQKIIDEKINPALGTHGGSCELIDVTDDNIVRVKLKGACGGCPGALITLKGFVLETLKAEISEISDIEAV